jgi:hypothetical protein
MQSGWIGLWMIQDFAIHSACLIPLTGVQRFSSVDAASQRLKAEERNLHTKGYNGMPFVGMKVLLIPMKQPGHSCLRHSTMLTEEFFIEQVEWVLKYVCGYYLSFQI